MRRMDQSIGWVLVDWAGRCFELSALCFVLRRTVACNAVGHEVVKEDMRPRDRMVAPQRIALIDDVQDRSDENRHARGIAHDVGLNRKLEQ